MQRIRPAVGDRKSTRLNSSHLGISYAVFCLKKKKLCDAVYQKSQQAYAEYTAVLEASKVKSGSLCQEAEGIGALSGASLFFFFKRYADPRTPLFSPHDLPPD